MKPLKYLAFSALALAAIPLFIESCHSAPQVQQSAKKTAPVNFTVASHPLTVMPQPQRVYTPAKGAKAFRFDGKTVIRVLDARDRPGAEMLAADLKFRAGLSVPILEGKSVSPPVGARVVRFERNSASSSATAKPSLLSQLETKHAEGYSLLVDEKGITVRGQDQRGVLYGAQTLRQLVRADLSVAPVAIQDWPEMKWRILYGYYHGVLTTPEQVREHVEQAALSKANMIILETNWSGGGNWWFNPTGNNKILADAFFETCRRFDIEPVPLVQGPGWGYGVTDLDPMTSEAEWVPNEELTLRIAEPTPLSKVNVVRTDKAPIVVTDLTGKTRYTEGQDYTVIQGDTTRPYPETNARWKLQAVAGGDIADGAKVLVSYNHVTPNYHKAYCLAEPRSYAIVDQTLDGVMKTYNPSIIHIGHDELWEKATDSRCKESGLKPEELVYRDLMHWYDKIKAHNPKATIMVWDDLFRDAPAGEVSGPLKNLVNRIPKDIILCPWIYNIKPEDKAAITQRLQSQTAMGFPVIGVPSGYWMTNSWDWRTELLPYLKNGKARGMMFTEWGEGLSTAALPASTELMWSGSKVNEALYKKFEEVAQRLKSKSLGFTYEYQRPWQQEAITTYFNESLKAGKTPRAVADEVRRELIGDTTTFEKVYGAAQWANIAHDAPFTAQQASMLRKLPILFEQIAAYFDAASLREKGDSATAITRLKAVIRELQGIGYFSDDTERELLRKSDNQWLSAKDVFGLNLQAPQDAVSTVGAN